jgi:hypothetical protein
MKLMAMLVGALVLVAGTGIARAANMFAGPLIAAGNDACECEILNVTATPKNVQIAVIDGTGQVLGQSPVFSLPAGHAASIISGSSGMQYCKFVNASELNFRASIACFPSGATSAGSDFVALPAR